MKKSKKKIIDFETKKTIHFNITREAHSDLRIACFKRRLSMQEVFENLAVRIVEGDEYLNNLVGEIDYNKKIWKIFWYNFLFLIYYDYRKISLDNK